MADDSALSRADRPHVPRATHNERPSPYTVSETKWVFDETSPSNDTPMSQMTVGSLVAKLSMFADLYEQATALIDSADVFEKPSATSRRDANADYTMREFQATCDIDRVRGYVLGRYGDELTIGTARRVLGDLIREHKLSAVAAGALHLGAAMDRLEAGAANTSDASRTLDPTANSEWARERSALAVALTQFKGSQPMPSGLTLFASLAGIFRIGVELGEAAVAVNPLAFAGLTATIDDPASERPRTLDLIRALSIVEEESYRMKRAMGAEVPHRNALLVDSAECKWGHFTQKFVGTDYGRAIRHALTKLATAAIDLSGFAVLRGPTWSMRDSGLILLRWGMAQLWEGMPSVDRNGCRELFPRLHAAIGWPTGPAADPAPYNGPQDIPVEYSYRCYTNFVGVGLDEINDSCHTHGDPTPPKLPLLAPTLPPARPAVILGLVNPPTATDKPQNSAAGKPSLDRQRDIIAAINRATTPLTRPELVEHMRMDKEGKLGANLAWMVANNILINVPQRGYWPCGVEVPE